jgi:hypothetical protein
MSTKELANFRMDLTNFREKIMPGQHKKFVQTIALKVLQGVIEKTPVDTGLCRGNWQVTGSVPAAGTIENTDKSGGSTIAQGQRVITTVNPMKEVIWVSNNLPYTGALEDGHSKQAPAGMVLLTLEEIKAKAALA